jgi:uncharacterized protein (DUF1330 family)
VSAYVIVYLESVSDPGKLAEYRRIGVPTLQQPHIKVLVRNGRFETLEGPAPTGVFMLEFPTMEAARAWYDSPEYQAALQHRLAGASCRVVLVEGVP